MRSRNIDVGSGSRDLRRRRSAGWSISRTELRSWSVRREPVLDGHRADRQVVTVDDKISDEFSGLTSALLRNPVIAHRGADFLVPHESHEDSGATPASAWRWA